jgi:hypothetical protein
MMKVIKYAEKRGIDLRGVLFDGKPQNEKEAPSEDDNGANGGGEKADLDESGPGEDRDKSEGKE